MCKFAVTGDKSRSSLLDFLESVDVCLFVWVPNATGILLNGADEGVKTSFFDFDVRRAFFKVSFEKRLHETRFSKDGVVCSFQSSNVSSVIPRYLAEFCESRLVSWMLDSIC